MLFLAVFCGFLAEYQLEHMIEHKREKQYVESMVHDIIEDTAKLSMIIDITSKKTNGIDSLLKNIFTTPYTDSSIKKMYGLTYYLSYRANMTFTKRTITQLKNSGGLRLIRNMEASDSIVVYDQACESAEKQFDVLYLHQLKARDLEYKIFDPRCRLPDNKNHKLLDDNVRLMMEYANWVSGTKYTHLYYGQLLKNLLKSATRTIEFLKKEYQLE